jgi:hypothetical protein
MSHMWGFASSKMLGDEAPSCMWQCHGSTCYLLITLLPCAHVRDCLGLRSPRYWCSGACIQKFPQMPVLVASL